MKSLRQAVNQKVIALAFFVGALPFLFGASVHAKNSSLFEEYRQPVGLTYHFSAKAQAAYMWRGLYAGGPNIQASADVGYGGFYVNSWWNIGVTDWSFQVFEPEMDWMIGFSRWGLDIYVLWVHNFDCPLFDFNNYPDKGNRIELDVSYTLCSKIPLSILWATRFAGADGYLDEKGDLKRAWSSYAQISYTQALPMGFSLYGAVGITPWKSLYTGYKRDFAVNNVELRLRKDWSVHNRLGLMLQGQVCVNASALAADPSTLHWHPLSPFTQAVNANIAFGIYLQK